MPVDTFTVLAEPTRRRILDELRGADSSVGELVSALAVSQPAVSKHLKVLRDAGFVSCRTAAQQRIYRLEPGPFEALDEWLTPYRRLWTRHLDALERHLDTQEAVMTLDLQPGPLADVAAEPADGGWTLVFVRDLGTRRRRCGRRSPSPAQLRAVGAVRRRPRPRPAPAPPR